jgi:predicted TIM-barrel fold metal-dependent hydrolase
LLQQLPAAHLTKLCVDVDFSSSASLQAVAGLTDLQHLELVNVAEAAATTAAAVIPDDVLAPLAAGLQQLTQLHVGPVRPAQLQWLPPKLQQLHVTVELCNKPQQLLQLASWLQQHASVVASLELQGGPSFRLDPVC